MAKLKLPKLSIEYEVRDKEGKLQKRGKIKSQSWVGNIIGYLATIIKGGTTGTSWVGSTQLTFVLGRADMRDTSNIARGIEAFAHVVNYTIGGEAPLGDDTFGILIGTSDTPVAMGQWGLGTKISHGSGGGQMSYGASTIEDMVKDATWYFRVIRTFTNNSGATITVRELGLILRLLWDYATSPYHITVMLARDVPTTAISVPAGSTLTLRYIISHALS